MLDNSDHFSFFERRLPVSMLHTGLHDQYHRPSDDPHLLNVEGIQAVSLLTLNFLVEVGNQPRLAEFRPRSSGESTPQQSEFERPPAQRPMRLGVAWEPRSAERGGGLLVRSVWTGTPADQAGVAAGDVIAGFNGQPVTSAEQLRREVITADAPVELAIERDGKRRVKRIELAGSPTRVGISWRSSDAEPGAVILSGVLAGSPAAVAGLRRLDRIHAVDGHEFAASEAFRELITRAGGRVQLLIERSGRMRLVDLELPDAETSDS
jgi:S1-C subfamily serine protease